MQPSRDYIEYSDGRSYDPVAVRSITQEWIDVHMKQRQEEFTELVSAKIFCGTWNVNAKKQETGLHDWLIPDRSNISDLYAIGFQEIVDLNALNVALDSSKTLQRSTFWQEQIIESLSSTGIKFQLVSMKAMVGLLLVVFVRDEIVQHVKDVRSSLLGVGIMGMMGNKGGVSIRLSLYDSSICFVCSHLAAHRENVLGRNSDYNNILEKCVFPFEGVRDQDKFDSYSNMVIRPRHGAAKTLLSDLTILDHEIIFWIGDLNYRLIEDIKLDQIFEHISNNNITYLLQYDQLNIQRQLNKVFVDFIEGNITFPPTYKYQPGTNIYDTRPEKKVRAPAWCDRILYKINDHNHIKQVDYNAANLLPSDHKPVYSNFICQLNSVVLIEEEKVYQELLMKIEFWKNDEIPNVSISNLAIDFNNLKFEVISETNIVINNIGKTIAHWRFVPKLEESSISKNWISVSIKQGLLLPDESVTINISAKIDKRTAKAINLAKEVLDDLLVLRVEKSKDYYISITSNYDRSCYGMTLEELCYCTEPIRHTNLPALAKSLNELPNVNLNDSSKKLSIPKELWRIIDALWNGNALKEKDLFSDLFEDNEVALIREALDCGYDFPSCKPQSLSQALVTFLECLAKPVIPTDLIPNTAVDSSNLKSFCRKFLESLPSLSYNVFVYVISFFREVLAQADFNRSSSSKLATIAINSMTSIKEDDPKQRYIFLLNIFEFLLTTTSI